jgi:ribosomal protein S18 acetylase RimI-like enzyme
VEVITVRRLALGDEEVVRYLSREDLRFGEQGGGSVERPPHTVETAREFLADDTNVQLVAFAADDPVGQLLAYELTRRHGDGKMMFIYEIAVRDDRRGRGVGRALFDELRAMCRSRGVGRSFVITNERNTAAMAFYRALGAAREASDDVVFDFDWS